VTRFTNESKTFVGNNSSNYLGAVRILNLGQKPDAQSAQQVWELREGISVESWWGGNAIFPNQKFHGRSRARPPESPA